MDYALILRLAVSAIGIVMLLLDFLLYCKKRIIERLAFVWAVLFAAVILIGLVPGLGGWSRCFPPDVEIILVVLVLIFIWILFGTSLIVSDLVAKNQELAMQVSLLNCEAERILRTLNSVTGKDIMDNK